MYLDHSEVANFVMNAMSATKNCDELDLATHATTGIAIKVVIAKPRHTTT
jgi:hypothetical protein